MSRRNKKMKVLIWAGCIVLGVVLNYMLLQATGFALGSVLLLVLIFYVAKKLCAAYDKQKEADSARKAETTGYTATGYAATEYNADSAMSAGNVAPMQNDVNDACVCPICGERCNNNNFCPKCGARVR